MAFLHRQQGKKRIAGSEIVFDLTQSGAQLSSTSSLASLDSIIDYCADNKLRTVLDFGAGRLRNFDILDADKRIKAHFSEFEALQSHCVAREDLRNAKMITLRLRNPREAVSDYLRTRLGTSTRRGVDRMHRDKDPSGYLQNRLVEDLNDVLWEDDGFQSAFGSRHLPAWLRKLMASRPVKKTTRLLRLNRFLLEAAYPTWVVRAPRTQIYPQEYAEERGYFDAILLSYVLHTVPHPEDREEILASCRKMLRAGGVLVVASPNYNSPIHQSLAEDGSDVYNESDAHGFKGWVRGVGRTAQTYYSEPSKKVLIQLVSNQGFGPIDPQPAGWKQRSAKVLGFRRV